jgi:hypothetical protein
MAKDKAQDNKLILHMVRGDQITAENSADFLKRLTGKDVTPEGMARLRALLDKPASE